MGNYYATFLALTPDLSALPLTRNFTLAFFGASRYNQTTTLSSR